MIAEEIMPSKVEKQVVFPNMSGVLFDNSPVIIDKDYVPIRVADSAVTTTTVNEDGSYIVKCVHPWTEFVGFAFSENVDMSTGILKKGMSVSVEKPSKPMWDRCFDVYNFSYFCTKAGSGVSVTPVVRYFKRMYDRNMLMTDWAVMHVGAQPVEAELSDFRLHVNRLVQPVGAHLQDAVETGSLLILLTMRNTAVINIGKTPGIGDHVLGTVSIGEEQILSKDDLVYATYDGGAPPMRDTTVHVDNLFNWIPHSMADLDKVVTLTSKYNGTGYRLGEYFKKCRTELIFRGFEFV